MTKNTKEVWANLQEPYLPEFTESLKRLSKRRLTEIHKLCWKVRTEKFDNHYKRPKLKKDFELTAEQLDRFFNAVKKEKYRVLFKTQFLLALRISEAIGINKANFDWSNSLIRITNSKTKEENRMFLSPATFNLLAEYFEANRRAIEAHDGYFFFAETKNKPISYVLADKRFKEASRRAGLPEWAHPHCLRHTALSIFYRQIKDIELTRLFARHISCKTTLDYYVHASQKELVIALNEWQPNIQNSYEPKIMLIKKIPQ